MILRASDILMFQAVFRENGGEIQKSKKMLIWSSPGPFE
jgi:hypothetical protein